MLPARPILVTGAHRSGTTWVGKSLAAGPRTAYVSEPLNVLHRPGVFGAKIAHWYQYICEENDAEFLAAFRRLLTYQYHFLDELSSLRSPRDLLRMVRDYRSFAAARMFRRRPLLKDPFAVFSLPWFAERLGCELVVTVRHPAAFASSLKRLGWSFDFQDLLQQPLLVRDYLGPYAVAMRLASESGIVDQAALLWTVIYGTLRAVAHEVPAIRFVRHEDLSVDPVSGFRRLYHELGLQFTAGAEKALGRMSSAENPSELPRTKVHSVRLDSRANLDNWKRRLSADEILVVRRVTEGVAGWYYPEAEWN
jgi:hypothetical protein